MFFQIGSGMILLWFYGCYMVKMKAQKKTGILTDQMGKGKSGTAKRIEILMKAASYLAVFAEVVSLFCDTRRFPLCIRVIGLILAIIGTIFFTAAVITMKNSWRAGVSLQDKTELITSGVFQISRNPAFLGFDLVYIGFILIFFNFPLLVISAFASIMFHLQIIHNEEPFLQNAFNQEYLNYQKHVRRYLGRY